MITFNRATQVVSITVQGELPEIADEQAAVCFSFKPAPGMTRKRFKQLERELPIRLRLFLSDLRP